MSTSGGNIAAAAVFINEWQDALRRDVRAFLEGRSLSIQVSGV